MINLILKDMLIQKKTFIMIIMASALLIPGIKNNIGGFYLFISVLTAYAFISDSFYRDEKAEIMLNSLPINKINIITAKYLSVFIFVFISITISFLLFIFAKYTGIVQLSRIINTKDMIGGLISTLFLSCIIFPIYFKYGYLKTRYATMILFFGILFVFTSLWKVLGEKVQPIVTYLSSIPEITMDFIIMAICFIVFSISFTLSYTAYKNKDL